MCLLEDQKHRVPRVTGNRTSFAKTAVERWLEFRLFGDGAAVLGAPVIDDLIDVIVRVGLGPVLEEVDVSALRFWIGNVDEGAHRHNDAVADDERLAGTEYG